MNDFCERGGVKLGEDPVFYSPAETYIDTGNSKYIEIGDGVKITKGVIILAHDWSYSVLNAVYGELPKNRAKTVIGNNVFIGMNSIILMGANIGDNVIIGAGAVVSGNIPSNTVWAGNPARQISTLDEFYKKRKSKFVEGAKMQACTVAENKKGKPTEEDMDLFQVAFLPRNEENYNKYFKALQQKYKIDPDIIMKSVPYYSSFDDFLDDCGI